MGDSLPVEFTVEGDSAVHYTLTENGLRFEVSDYDFPSYNFTLTFDEIMRALEAHYRAGLTVSRKSRGK